MEFYTFTLPNGIRCIHTQTDRPVGHCGLVIDAGSRDELESEAGLAHFIEQVISACAIFGDVSLFYFSVASLFFFLGGRRVADILCKQNLV